MLGRWDPRNAALVEDGFTIAEIILLESPEKMNPFKVDSKTILKNMMKNLDVVGS